MMAAKKFLLQCFTNFVIKSWLFIQRRFLLRVIDIFGKYACVVPLKDKKSITTTNAFQKILDVSGSKPNKF